MPQKRLTHTAAVYEATLCVASYTEPDLHRVILSVSFWPRTTQLQDAYCANLSWPVLFGGAQPHLYEAHSVTPTRVLPHEESGSPWSQRHRQRYSSPQYTNAVCMCRMRRPLQTSARLDHPPNRHAHSRNACYISVTSISWTNLACLLLAVSSVNLAVPLPRSPTDADRDADAHLAGMWSFDYRSFHRYTLAQLCTGIGGLTREILSGEQGQIQGSEDIKGTYGQTCGAG